jgi:hypothetical protein
MSFLKKPNRHALIWLAVFSVAGFCCTRFYKPVAVDTGSPDVKRSVIATNATNKYFILRQGTNNYALNNITVDNIANTLHANLSLVSETHRKYLTASGRKYKYKKSGDGQYVLNEVHIYSKDSGTLDISQPLVFPLDKVEKIEVIEHDKGRTTTSYVLGGIGITLGVVAVMAVIVALTKSSCPFVSVFDGETYNLQGELFGGAINPKLERADFLPLKARPVQGEFVLRISNELKERQYTDVADLLVIEHPDGSEALMGTDGNIYRVSHPVMPISALLNNRLDVSSMVKSPDNIVCNFDDAGGAAGMNELSLRFNNPGTVKKGKLVLELKNSYWFDFLYGQFTSHFGNRYDYWQKKQSHEPAEKMQQWAREQNIPLRISMNTNAGSREILNLNTIGPLMNRKVVIPVDIPEGNDPIRISLSTGFMFWQLDYAALDLSADGPMNVITLKPYSAIDENGNDVLYALTGNDHHYLSQPHAGSHATLRYRFTEPPGPGMSYSVILSTRGYYEPIREFRGKADTRFLKQFKEPGFMSVYSRETYLSATKQSSSISLTK